VLPPYYTPFSLHFQVKKLYLSMGATYHKIFKLINNRFAVGFVDFFYTLQHGKDTGTGRSKFSKKAIDKISQS